MLQASSRRLHCGALAIAFAQATVALYHSEESSLAAPEKGILNFHPSVAKRSFLRKEESLKLTGGLLKAKRQKTSRGGQFFEARIVGSSPPAPPGASSPSAPAASGALEAPAPASAIRGGPPGAPAPPGAGAALKAPAAPGAMNVVATPFLVQPPATPALTPSGPIPTCGGDAKGAPCKFPFVYGLDLSGVPTSHDACISIDHDQPWCITDTIRGFWGNCDCVAAAPPSPPAVFAPSISLNSKGRPGCPCVAIDVGSKLTAGGVAVNINGNAVMYPSDMLGGGCKAWDAGIYPESCNVKSPESWCAKQWCYVDPCQCSETRKVSSYFDADIKFKGNPLHFSYKTCGEEDSYSGANTCGVQVTLADCSALSHCKWEVWAAFPQGMCQSKAVSCGLPTPLATPATPLPDSIGNDQNPEPDVPEVMVWRNKTIDNQVATAKVVFVSMQLGGISFNELTSHMYDRLAYSLIKNLEAVTGIETKHIETTIQPIAQASVDDDAESVGARRIPMKNRSVLLQAAITLPEGVSATDVQAIVKLAEKMLSQSQAADVSKLEGLKSEIVVQQPTAFISLPGSILGTDACENKQLSQERCMKVGCCKFDHLNGCQSAVGRSLCNSLTKELPASEAINFGNERCPCIGIAGAGGDSRMIIGTLSTAYPMDVGTSCKAWDLGRYPGLCNHSDSNLNAAFCKQEWCFVDPCKCAIDVVPRKASSFLPVSKSEGRPLYFSYRTCGGTDQWTAEQHKNACVNQFDKQSCEARSICAWSGTDPGVCAGKEQLDVCTNSILFTPKRNSLQLGHEACPCVGITAIPGSALVRIDDMGVLYPAEAGKSCGAWDNGRYPNKCTLGSDHQSPGMNEGWCAQTWCYVDPCNCNLPIAPKKSSYFPDALFQGRSLYYSYATCGATDYYTTSENPSNCISKSSEALCSLGKRCVWSHDSCMDEHVAKGCKDARLPPSLLRKPEPPQAAGNLGPPQGSLASTRRRRETADVKRRHYGNSKCKCVGIEGADGTLTTKIDGNDVSISVDFGSYCNAWNAVQSFVEGYSQTEAWCYVDPCECDIDSPPQKSEVFREAKYKGRPRYYSYATCGKQEAVQISNAMCRKQSTQNACEELGGVCGWSMSLQKCGFKEVLSNCDANTYFQAFGYESCPCVGWSGQLQGTTRVLLGNEFVDYPANLGATCEPWDNGRYPDACTLDPTQQNPGKGTDWCIKRWCFVDPCQCSLKIRPKPSSYFKDGKIRGKPIYYSYATCGEFDTSTEQDLLIVNASGEDMCESATEPDKQVIMSFKLKGMDFYALTPPQILFIKERCADHVGSEVGIHPNKVGIELSAGSVIVKAKVPVLPGLSVSGVQDQLQGVGGAHVTANIIQDLTRDSTMVVSGIRPQLESTPPEVEVTTLTTTTTLIDQAVLVNKYQRVFGSTPVAGIEVGNPPRQVDVIFDTGSDKLVIKSLLTVMGMLKFAGEEGITKNHIRGTLLLYDHDGSSTWVQKTTIKDGTATAKKSKITYGSGSAVTLEGLDDVGIGGRRLSYFGVSEIAEDSLDMLHTSEKIFGIMGLMHMKNRTFGESAFSRLRDAGAMTAFGYCLTDVEGNMGAVIWGDTSNQGRQVPVEGQRHWAVKLFDVKVPGRGSLVPSPSRGESEEDSEGSGDDKANEAGASTLEVTNATAANATDETVVEGTISLNVSDANQFTFNLATQAAMKAALRQLLGLTEQTSTSMSFIMAAASTADAVNVDGKYRVGVNAPPADLQAKVQSLNAPDAAGLNFITSVVVGQLQSHGWQSGALVTASTCQLFVNQGPPTPWPAPSPPNAPCEAWTEQGYKCVLPFRYQNITYNSCTTVGQEQSGLYWCLASADANGNQLLRANCKPNLPCNPQSIPPPPPTPATPPGPPPPGEPTRRRRSETPVIHVFQPCTMGSGGCAAIIDTGSNILGGPRAEVAKLARLLQVSKDCDNLATLPDIQITLGQTSLVLPPIGYIMKIRIPAWMKQKIGNSNFKSRHIAWSNAVKEVMKRSGVDLRPAMGVDKGWDLSRVGLPSDADMEHLCLPALTSIDIMTQLGPLWVIGKPIFSKYYVRWSFAQKAASPSIFVEESKVTSACNTTKMPPMPDSRWGSDDGAGHSGSSDYNQEPQHKQEGANRDYIDAAEPADRQVSRLPLGANRPPQGRPPAMDFEDIRHPYWIHELHGVL